MEIIDTGIKDLLILKPKVFYDERGYFFESYNQNIFKEITGLDIDFVQDNQSFSTKGVLRGLHYQVPPFDQAKLVRVIKGKVLDVAVDLRVDSETFGRYYSVELSGKNNLQFFIPSGFAHGFITLSKSAIFNYKCSGFYSKEHEGGVLYNDEQLNIDWKLNPKSFIVSEKDLQLPVFGNNRPFIF
ncbi:MAG: dTDP-4-dehydrorhamnose 3,5-epimerase [Saprospiraceae bacterium]